jgi:catechol 2,3-dioxygenase-like lactoylglutathione lyase family enzyme
MRFLHFGFKVNDIEATSRAYAELFGLTWEPIREFELVTRVGDATGPVRSKVTHAWTDDGTEIELVQTVAGRSVDTELMGDREGLSHLAFQVEDLAVERARLEAAGVNVLSEGTAPRAAWFFVHDPRLGGALVQLVQLHAPPAG